MLTDQGPDPILLSLDKTFREQGITSSHILALRATLTCTEQLSRHHIRIPDWVKFHKAGGQAGGVGRDREGGVGREGGGGNGRHCHMTASAYLL